MNAELGQSGTESEIRFNGGRKRAKRIERDQSPESHTRERGRRRVWDDERESEELREYFGVCRIDIRSERDCGESIQGPSPTLEAPARVQTGSPSQVDPILAAAHYFHGLGIVTVITTSRRSVMS
ncbi:hypothetical protein KFL_010100013 [Klebsormidium nitens]|uniref:Uncharacterized protein n=1 Tax=Klebsormidium nitens TaxID=105231 RepID=A0A1Y1ISX7_KLENI|nr:hypothetical protein KFL_010100013 [Klebsormidium nitens]|eukprot:GAQ92411.1 hypothetical protein KFL_010100013 [Klebsormidium nitens]